MTKGETRYHTGIQANVKLIRCLKTRLPGFWTVEILDGPRAGQWYDAAPALLEEKRP